MKRKLCLFFVITIVASLGFYAYAKEYNVNDYEYKEEYDYEGYLPDKIKEILGKNGVENIDELDLNSLLSLVFFNIKSAFFRYYIECVEILVLIFVTSIVAIIIDNNEILSIFSILFNVILSLTALQIFNKLTDEVYKIIQGASEILSVSAPTFITVFILGGYETSAVSIGASTSLILSLLSGVISELGLSLLTVAFIFMIFENIVPYIGDSKIVSKLKKYVVSTLTFVMTLALTVLSAQNLISARADSLSMRTVKFASSNFIPIVGSAVGESLRTVISGVDFLKSSVGLSICLSIALTVLPLLCEVLALKLLISFASLTSSFLSVKLVAGLLDSYNEVLGLLLSIIICCVVLSLIVPLIFITVSFGG